MKHFIYVMKYIEMNLSYAFLFPFSIFILNYFGMTGNYEQ